MSRTGVEGEDRTFRSSEGSWPTSVHPTATSEADVFDLGSGLDVESSEVEKCILLG